MTYRLQTSKGKGYSSIAFKDIVATTPATALLPCLGSVNAREISAPREVGKSHDQSPFSGASRTGKRTVGVLKVHNGSQGVSKLPVQRVAR